MSTNRDRGPRITNQPLVPTPNPNVVPVGCGLLGSIATLYNKLMTEILDGDEQDVLGRATQLFDAARRLEMLLTQYPGFNGPDTEMYLQGDIDVRTGSPEMIREVMADQELEHDLGPEDSPCEVSFHVPQGDSVQCFFRSVDIGPTIVDDTIVPYQLGFHVTNALLTPADSSISPLFIPGLSSIYPSNITNLVMGLVQET